MTTLQPRRPYTEEELLRLYPPGLELQLVEILMRHGERTPVNERFQNAGLHPFWPYCSAVKQFRSAVLEDSQDAGVAAGGAVAGGPLGTLAWRRRLETFGAGDTAVMAERPPLGKAKTKSQSKPASDQTDGLCDMGMLTDPGRATTLRLGQRLRQLYVDRLGYLPPTLGPADAEQLFYLRTTPIPRSLESLQQAFTGLYPAATRATDSPDGGPSAPPPLTIVSRAPADETLYPNDGNCRRLAELARAFAQRTADRWNDSPELAHASALIGRWLPPDSPRVAVDGKPRLSGLMDTVNATLAHGPATRLPPAFYDARLRRDIEHIALEEWFSGYAESSEYRALGIGALLGDVVARLAARAEAETRSSSSSSSNISSNSSRPDADTTTATVKMGISGCHDTTLAAVLTSLGHTLPAWPPFTSHLAIELFKKQEPQATDAGSGPGWLSSLFRPASASIGRKPISALTPAEKQKLAGYYVRVRYNDEPVTIPACRSAGKHLDGDQSFCTLEAFKAVVDRFTPSNWKQQCRSNLGAPAFPAETQPADARL